MGRHRQHVAGYTVSGEPHPDQRIIERRLGHLNPICANCKKKNPMGRETCVRCGRSDMRRSAKHPSVGYRDK